MEPYSIVEVTVNGIKTTQLFFNINEPSNVNKIKYAEIITNNDV